MNSQIDYTKYTYLGTEQDCAHHRFDAYLVEDEIHIVYGSGHIAVERVENIKENSEEYIWTPYIYFLGQI
jgi:hypothetical protein